MGGKKMKKTKIDWIDCTENAVIGCKNGCEYCYARRINDRFGFVDKWSEPKFFEERLTHFKSKQPKSVFIDSMSDIGCWEQEWIDKTFTAINANPQHNYVALTKCPDWFMNLLGHANVGLVKNFYWGVSVTRQSEADKYSDISCDFWSIEPILEKITLPKYTDIRTIIIGAETGNRQGKIIPQKQWIDNLVKEADEKHIAVFMKESLHIIMGDNFRQDKLPWDVSKK